MSNQTRKELVKDLARKRREYLKHVAFANVKAGLWLLGAVGIFAYVVFSIVNEWHVWASIWPTVILLVFGFLMILLLSILGSVIMRYDESVPRVPPVAEQLASLRAHEILVRSSDQPAAAAEELLRAAQAGKETGSEELLRAQGGTQ